MKKTIAELIQLSNQLFEEQYPMLPLYQTLSEHFYPERADFTIARNIGTEIADGIIDSYPVLMRRDLANSFAPMLRDGNWFDMAAEDVDHSGKMWLEYGTDKLKRLIDRQDSNFVRSTKQGDHDYATFGQTVLSVELNKMGNGLLFRSWMLRDCAWFEDETGQVGGVTRKWKPKVHQLREYFKEEQLHKTITDATKKNEQFKDCDIRHIVIPTTMYGDDELQEKYPFVSIFIDVKNQHVIEEQGLYHKFYCVPRFQTIAGSAYAYSPATICALPNARCLQAMTFTLLEAGERYTRPPVIAVQKVIRSDVDLSPDGITWVDDEYDQKTGAALAPMQQNMRGFPYGMEMRENVVDVLSSSFYLNKLSLPEAGNDMTAYEVQERMKQYRRENLPLFQPIESEYNGQLCEMAFTIAMQAGLLGSPYDIPQSLKGQEVLFKFQSPLTESEKEKKVNQFKMVGAMLSDAAAIDPSVTHNINVDVAFRDAVDGTGAPARWLKDMKEVTEGRQADAVKQALAQANEANKSGLLQPGQEEQVPA